MLQFREYQPGDSHYVIDIENKTDSPDPFSAADWSNFGTDGGDVILATWHNEPVGFIAWRPDPLGIFIIQVAVKRSYQGRGVGTSLVNTLREFARTQGVQKLLCCPDEPDWLTYIGFKESSYNLYYLEV